jgi:hypothetical protein
LQRNREPPLYLYGGGCAQRSAQVEDLVLIFDTDVGTLIHILLYSFAIWMSGCIGYAVGAWQTRRSIETQRPLSAGEIFGLCVGAETTEVERKTG